ncbi:tRNA A-37 threonylcarbamoyl transferase component Bud32 [Streptomyces sp. V3I8]|uniref:serine/threonine-protein kinase n=1 Tax=Streptomyces sp. V3I8 TaxID=3042279 RepID=UPI00277FBBEE|nr:serine/threonine-protein kinase [Streptomyces sp. V3I8]MDQ1036665.1 tRNA A-37 threonylcarbamoyl transferase component Bud32 [Streptomyces sp. V3I8]
MSEAERAGASRQDDNGRLLAGRYRLGGVLGRGGMGTVWRAEDETLGRTVAVKELRLPPRIDEDEKRRLITRTFREAKAIARIRNNSAVTVYDVVDEDDRPWIVMELVEGKSLAEVIREDGLLTPKRAAEVGLAILDVLRSAHREGILHRDVKPSNVLIAEDGRVVLTDFGIAQVEGDPSITSTGMLVGAPSYISPERARGHKPGPAADLWSLGGLLYAAVEGVPPYDKGSAIATLTAVMTEPVEQPKNAGPLENVIYGLLVKDPEQRLDDAGARAMLTEVINTPEPEDEPEPVDATKIVPLPDIPAQDRAKKGTPGGGRKSEEPADRLRGALRSARKGKGKAKGKGAAAGAVAAAGAAGTGVAADRPAQAPGGPAGAASAPAAPGAPARSASAGDPGPASGARSAPAAAATGAAAGGTAAGGTGAEGTGAAASAQHRDAAAVLNSSAVGGSSGGSGGAPARTTTSRAPLTDVVSRRSLVIVAVVVALAVLGTILAVTLGGDDGSASKGDKGGADTSTSSGANAGSDTKQDEGSGTGKDDDGKAGSSSGGATEESSPSASASGESDDSGGSQDGSGSGSGSGVESTHKDGQGFSIGLPKGWKYQSTSAAGARFAGPDGQKLLVGWTTTPKSDPVADWKNQERFMRRSQYERIRIEKVDYRGWNTADWEFTYVESGTQYRSIDRGFVVDGSQGYALMYTAKASKWGTELREETWRTLTKSFEPKS